MTYDLLICIRCHKYLDFVLDTEQSVRYNTDPARVKIVFAVDGGTGPFASELIRFVGAERVYVSETQWGWGAGLYSLLVESIKHFRHVYQFNHFQSIDYDTLYINKGADEAILNLITSENIGLLGCYKPQNEHWAEIFKKNRTNFIRTFGEPPTSYSLGEGVQGGFMTLAAAALEAMEKKGMFERPFSVAREYTPIADDHLLPIFVRMCGLDIVDTSGFANCSWAATNDPRGSEEKGVLVFHPTKLTPHNVNRSTEIYIRNYFRAYRKAPDLLAS